ncbi:MAG: GAF domain-containing sensor histidine kinase [Deltaproteobacteria bacterium]|nr:GAF domain-containing sensor histidine kinase [Deltaproteobacteria bacterium]
MGRFDDADQALLEGLATPVALAIRTNRHYRKEQRRLAQLTLLNEIGRIITSTVELDELLPRVVDSIRERLGYALVAIGFVDDAQQEVELRAASSQMLLDLPIGHRQRLGVGVVGEALRKRASLLVPDVRDRPNYVSAHADVRSEMCTPLWVEGRIIGFLDVEATEPDAFDEADQMLVETLAEHISQAVQNARNLQRMHEQRQELAAMLVHDLRSPLTVIQAGTELVTEGDGEADDDRAEQGRAMLMACDRMKALIDGVLELQKLESGEMSVTPDPTDAAEVVRDVCVGLELVAKRASVELCSEPADGLSPVLADPALLTRILENLVSNALRVTPAAGRVTVALAVAPPSLVEQELPGASGGAILFTVEDTGPGVPSEHRARIFDKFATLESRLSGNQHTTGVGLAFCREAVQVQGGVIWVEGATGPGARFCVLLPQAQGDG